MKSLGSARGSAKVQEESMQVCVHDHHTGLLDWVWVLVACFFDIVVTFFKASVSKTLNSTNQSASTPCALYAAHTTRLERPAFLPRSCDVSDVTDSLPQILAAPCRSRFAVSWLWGWHRFVFSAGEDVHWGKRKKQEQQLIEYGEGEGIWDQGGRFVLNDA